MNEELIAKLEAATAGSRFLSKVNILGPKGCWLWKASKNQAGYGQFSVGSRVQGTYRNLRAHRYAYEIAIGPVPEGLVLDHICNTKDCVNPTHLRPSTNRENILRGTSPSALASRKTQCPHGHPYVGENLYIRPNGSRECRICKRRTWRKDKERLRALKART